MPYGPKTSTIKLSPKREKLAPEVCWKSGRRNSKKRSTPTKRTLRPQTGNGGGNYGGRPVANNKIGLEKSLPRVQKQMGLDIRKGNLHREASTLSRRLQEEKERGNEKENLGRKEMRA